MYVHNGTGYKGRSENELYRKTNNTGDFAGLNEPMQLKHVKKIAEKAGVGLDGVKVKIIRDKELVGTGLLGWANPNGKEIHLYPDAFTDTKTLVETLGHERTHIYQTRTLGKALDNETLSMYEKAAYGIENEFWKYYLKQGGK